MIKRNIVTVALYKTEKQKQLDFGTEEKDVLIDCIEIAIFEKSVTAYEQNSVDNIKYDYIGLTSYAGIEKGMFIISGTRKYKVNFVQHSKKYFTAYLERIV